MYVCIYIYVCMCIYILLFILFYFYLKMILHIFKEREQYVITFFYLMVTPHDIFESLNLNLS